MVVTACCVYWAAKIQGTSGPNYRVHRSVVPTGATWISRKPIHRNYHGSRHYVRHNNGAYGDKLLPETMGGGVAFFDFDNDDHP
jgi:hypothetical protein